MSGKLTKAQRELLSGLAESPRYVALTCPSLAGLLTRRLAEHTRAPWMWRRPQTAITALGRQALTQEGRGEGLDGLPGPVTSDQRTSSGQGSGG